MEKYARQALSEGVKSDSELHVSEDSELYRVLNVHYNRNNHIEVSRPVLLNSKMFFHVKDGLGYCYVATCLAVFSGYFGFFSPFFFFSCFKHLCST
jgi:hypothetical protein